MILSEVQREGQARLDALHRTVQLAARPYRVLVVDDDAADCENLARLLKPFKCETVVRFSGAGAVAEVKSTDFDLILLDIRMPGMDGIDTLEALNAVKANLNIIIITGYDDIDLLQKALSHGAVTVVLKPVTVDDMAKLFSVFRAP